MGQIKKGRIPNVFSKESLMKAIKNTYGDAVFMAYFCNADVKDFTRRGCSYYSDTMTGEEVLTLLRSN